MITADKFVHNYYLGRSEIAKLTIRYQLGLLDLPFDINHFYTAEIFHDLSDADLLDYELVISITDPDGQAWVWIYDDSGCTVKISHAYRIDIYRLGIRSCLINLVGDSAIVNATEMRAE